MVSAKETSSNEPRFLHCKFDIRFILGYVWTFSLHIIKTLLSKNKSWNSLCGYFLF